MQQYNYFESLKKELKTQYELAEEARKKGLDPKKNVEIPLADDTAARCEGLISTLKPGFSGSGLKERIRELEEKIGKGKDEVAFEIAGEITDGKFTELGSKEEKVEYGLRVALAYLTLGLVTAPLEGVSHVKLKKRKDGKEYVAVYFAGPIRSAGGTANAMAVILADYLRDKLGIAKYDPTENEVERFVVELDTYHTRCTNLQYFPDPDETRMIAKNLGVEVDGDPTERMEVLAQKDLPRVETNRVRGGMCLTMSMIALKSSKLLKRTRKYGGKYNLENWKYLEEFEELKHSLHAKKKVKKKGGEEKKIKPNFTFMSEIPGGRPVFSFPSAKGGFRLRYGRARNTGFASCGLNPATMIILDSFMAVGTQIKTERPGKAAAVAPVDSILGPLVRLKNGDVLRINTVSQARKRKDEVEKILQAGDILFCYGEFLTNGHTLMPGGFSEEWWLSYVIEKTEELEDAPEFLGLSRLRFTQILSGDPPSFPEAEKISRKLKLPLHPKFTYYYHDVEIPRLKKLKKVLSENPGQDKLPLEDYTKETLEIIGVPHKLRNNRIELFTPPLRLALGVDSKIEPEDAETSMEYVNKTSSVEIKPFAPAYIGTRMGRPEKSERRLMKGRPQVLFPVGRAGGRMRSVNEAEEKSYKSEVANRFCEKCKKNTYYLSCPDCGQETRQFRFCKKCGKTVDKETHCRRDTSFNTFSKIEFNLEKIAESIGEKVPDLVKGVRGLTSRVKIPERLEKGILRSNHNLYVNKDGTCRLDATDMPLTHFRPEEIGVSVEKLRGLGYTHDSSGKELEKKDQLLQLKPQDIIISSYKDETLPSGVEYLFNCAEYIDDLLEKFYGLPPFYNLEKEEDLIGQLVVGLAPHTSAGILGRIIGFIPARSGFAHPAWHAAKKRNCDGDEDSVMLLLDALINFSQEYLPDTRGGRTMDAPLVLTTSLRMDEVDDEVWDMDIVGRYPLSFYEACEKYKEPWEVDIKKVKDVISEKEPEIFFTNQAQNINDAPLITSYKSLGPMLEKVRIQLELAERLRSVKEEEVARIIIETHFLKDIKGNIRTFTTQKIRCIKCNAKYRRVPLKGVCTRCGGKLVLTVYRGTIEKYLEPSIEISQKYHVPDYILQELKIIQKRLVTMFGKEKTRQEALSHFF